MERITISDFLDKEYRAYSFYTLKRRAIPSIVDGLKTTQRKILYCAMSTWNKHNTKIKKVYQFAGIVAATTSYHHANTSLEDAIIQLGQDFKNPLTFLETEGQWGFLRVPEAGAARYIGCSLSKNFHNVFKDFEIVPEQFDEGEKIEPLYMLPIVPIHLINGTDGIAVAHASKILMRHPKRITEVCIKHLKGERYLNTFKPFIPGFSGAIEQDADNPLKWWFRGKFNIINNTTLLITEYSPSMTFERIEKLLSKLENDKVILGYENNSKENVNILVKMKSSDLAELSETAIRKLFNLDSSKTENLTLLDENEKIIIFKSITEIIEYFINFRLQKYSERKHYLLEKLANNALIASNKYRFINEVVTDKIKVNKQTRDSVIKQLDKGKYAHIDSSFGYLLSMPIHSLTKEKMKELKNIIDNIKTEIKKIKETLEKDMFIEDLENFLKTIK